MLRFLKQKYLEMYPPEVGDVFYRNWLDFINLSDIKKGLYGFKSIDSEWEFIPDELSYRFTIESDGMPYYICKVEILVIDIEFPDKSYWIRNKDSMPARIWKKEFIEMILDKRMVKR